MGGHVTVYHSWGEENAEILEAEEENTDQIYDELGDGDGFTVRENELLNRMAAGELDGVVGEPQIMPKGMTIWFVIQKGIPTCYFELPTKLDLEDGKVKRTPGAMLSLKCWETEKKKLTFLREYGKEIKDDEVRTYAEQYAKKDDSSKPRPKILIDWDRELFEDAKVFPLDIPSRKQ